MKKHVAPSTQMTEEVFSALLVVLVLLVLPQLGALAMVLGSTAGFALYVYLYPDRFRTRSGSLRLAVGLVTFLALLAGIVLVMSLTHQLK
jgi:hypothetical protein